MYQGEYGNNLETIFWMKNREGTLIENEEGTGLKDSGFIKEKNVCLVFYQKGIGPR